MIIQGKNYPIIGYIKASWGQKVPLVDMPMMSDEEWHRSARQNAVENYIKKFGKEPENEDIAVKWQRNVCTEMAEKYKGEKVRTGKDGRIIG